MISSFVKNGSVVGVYEHSIGLAFYEAVSIMKEQFTLLNEALGITAIIVESKTKKVRLSKNSESLIIEENIYGL